MIQKIRFILISKVQFLIILNSKILQIYAVNRLSFENIYLTKWTVGLNLTRTGIFVKGLTRKTKIRQTIKFSYSILIIRT